MTAEDPEYTIKYEYANAAGQKQKTKEIIDDTRKKAIFASLKSMMSTYKQRLEIQEEVELEFMDMDGMWRLMENDKKVYMALMDKLKSGELSIRNKWKGDPFDLSSLEAAAPSAESGWDAPTAGGKEGGSFDPPTPPEKELFEFGNEHVAAQFDAEKKPVDPLASKNDFGYGGKSSYDQDGTYYNKKDSYGGSNDRKKDSYDRRDSGYGGDRNKGYGSYDRRDNNGSGYERRDRREGGGGGRSYEPRDRFSGERGDTRPPRPVYKENQTLGEIESRAERPVHAGWESVGKDDRNTVVLESKANALRSDAFTEERDEALEQKLFQSTSQTGIHFDEVTRIPVKVSGPKPVKPVESFQQAEIHPHVMENIRLCKFKQPTPVQRYGIPSILARRDLMGCAETGSGKTAAFLIPIITVALRNKWHEARTVTDRKASPMVLILAPTRELSCQIFDEARKFSYRTGFRPCVAYGGAQVYPQLDDMMKGCHMLIGTPGRLMDFIERGRLTLDNIRIVVLDEADRMLDMGFESQIRRMVGMELQDKQRRQTLLFSATFPRTIQELASDFLREDYLYLLVGRLNAACTQIEQQVIQCEGFHKRDQLLELLGTLPRQRVLIFVQSKRFADQLDDFLYSKGFPCTSIHGDRSQQQREAALLSFRRGLTPILVATDVASRGLDIPAVGLVIVYDFPTSIEDYIHRIGRTARAGNEGRAITFFSSTDYERAPELIAVLKNSNQPIPQFLLDGNTGASSSSFNFSSGQFNKDIRRDKSGW